MSEPQIGLDQFEEEILTCEVSDKALETAGDTGERGITLTFCTWNIGCPA